MAPGGSRIAVIAALIGSSLIAIVKVIAVGIVGSASMVAEGIHSAADVGKQAMLLAIRTVLPEAQNSSVDLQSVND